MKDISVRVRKKNNYDIIWYIIIFLFSLNFLGMRSYLLIFLLLVGLIIIGIKKAKFKFTTDFFYIIMFSVSYYLIILIYNPNYGLGAILQYLIGPIIAYFIGYFIVTKESRFISNTIFVIIIGNFIYGFLNMLIYFNSFGFQTMMRRVPDVWTGLDITATLQGTHFTLISSTLFLSFLLLKKIKNKLIPIFFLFGALFSVYSSLILGNRTLIFILLIVLIMNILFYLILNLRDFYKFFNSVILLILLSIITWYVYSNNLFGVKEVFESSSLYNRIQEMVLLEDPRLNVYFKAMEQMFLYPFGGYKMDLGLSYAHNLWIDVLYSTGLISFFFLLLFTIKVLINTVYIIYDKNVEPGFKLLVLSVFSGYILNFMVEPILEGVPYMFITFCLIGGMIRKYKDVLKFYTSEIIKRNEAYEYNMAN